jgi:hypothetical protein
MLIAATPSMTSIYLTEAQIEAIAGQEGADVTISSAPLVAVPGEATVVAKSKALSYQDYGLKWGGLREKRILLTLHVQGPVEFRLPSLFPVSIQHLRTLHQRHDPVRCLQEVCTGQLPGASFLYFGSTDPARNCDLRTPTMF